MWNQWKNWKKILRWTSPFIIIAVLVAMFWPDSKAVSTLPESFKLTTETELTSLGSNGTSIKLIMLAMFIVLKQEEHRLVLMHN